MRLLDTYLRAVGMLAPEKGLATLLMAASVILACVQLAEPVLFGWVVDALSKEGGAFSLIALWAALGLVGILAGVIVAIYSDRLAHRRRLLAMSEAFDRAMSLPLSYHTEKGSGGVVNTILRGTNMLFEVWLSIMHVQIKAIAGVLLLIPTALSLDARMTAVLALLAVVYALLNFYIVSKTRNDQRKVETYHSEVTGRLVDVLGNLTVVQNYTRLSAESQALRAVRAVLFSNSYTNL